MMKEQLRIKIITAGFACYWIFLWIFCRYYAIFEESIPQVILDSGYIDSDGMSPLGYLVGYGIPIYFMLYFTAVTVSFFQKKLSVKHVLFFAGMPLVVSLLILLASQCTQ